MPPAVVMKWASDKGMSDKEAERRWENAKLMAAKAGRNPEVTKQQDDWRYVMGIFKSMMGKKKTEAAVALVDLVLEGVAPHHALDIYLADQRIPIREADDTIGIGVSFDAGMPIKTFFDGLGRLRFCTEDDVLIDPSSDSRLRELMQYADALDVDSPLFDLFESFEGNLATLYKQVTDAFSLVSQIGT